MPLNPEMVGLRRGPLRSTWDSKDAILYALGVGAGTDDLQFTTENTQGVAQQALPSMAVVLSRSDALDHVGSFDWTQLVHASQEIEVHRRLPVTGAVDNTTTVTGIYDKGSAAIVTMETVGSDPATEEPSYTTRASAFIRGAGGW
ncbi:MAG: hypothetical protein M3Z25_06100 [Actinomycetota bacterium]|nr:hypothetical protein [Actinomycetota bacterium]